MNAKKLTENYEQAGKSLLEAAKTRKAQMNGIPFGHEGQCDICHQWVSYNDRMLFTEEDSRNETVTCYWCAMEPKFKWSPNPEQAMRMIKHILSKTNNMEGMQEPKETDIRELENQLFALEAEIDQLGEFIYDDYGDTVEQLGLKETSKLELHYSKLKGQCNEIKKQIQEIEQQTKP